MSFQTDYEQPAPVLNRNYPTRPEDLDLRLSSSLEDLIPEDAPDSHLDTLLDHNLEIYQEMEQLRAKITLLQEQKEVNDYQIAKLCCHEWVRGYQDPGSGRTPKVCKHCGLLSGSIRFLYK